MTFFLIAALFVIPVLVIPAALVAKSYNRLVALKNSTENGFSQISVQLQRRHDLIPSLVECVKAYMGHERETLEAVIAARNTAVASLKNAKADAGNSVALASVGQSEGMLAGALGRLSMVMEDYPELKANENVAHLTEELTSTENRIAFSRQSYNDWVTAFNIYRQTFPTTLFASFLGFDEDASLLEMEDEEAIKQAPQIQLA